MNPLISRILEDVVDKNLSKQIRPFDLKHLGYLFSKRRIKIYNTNYDICQIIHEDKKTPASFCFLLAKNTLTGIVLPTPFEEYLKFCKKKRTQVAAT